MSDLDWATWRSVFDLPQETARPTDPNKPEAVIGFRYFRLRYVNVAPGDLPGNIQFVSPATFVVLQSLTQEFVWKPGWNLTVCSEMENLLERQSLTQPLYGLPFPTPPRPPHTMSDGVCGGMCGFWACTDVQQLTHVTMINGLQNYKEGVVLCGVQACGNVIVCEHGWRAEKAKVVAICPSLPGRIVKDKRGSIAAVLSARRDEMDARVIQSVATFYGLKVVPIRHIEQEMRRLTS